MVERVFVYDNTQEDPLSKVRGIGRYLQILKEALPDAVFSTDLSKAPLYDILINPFFNVIRPPLIKKRYGQRQIAVVHDLVPLKHPDHFPLGPKGKLTVFFNKRLLRHYDLIVTDSEASKRDIEEKLKVKSEKLKVIYPALPKLFIDSTRKISNFKFQISNYCVYVGDATWNKNLVTLAQAVLLADVQCVCVGNVFTNAGPALAPPNRARHLRAVGIPPLGHPHLSNPWQKEFKKFLEIAKDDPHFIFPGFISDEELITLYQNAVCNILVSRDEGFGYSYFEAASQQTPSVLSDIPVFKETANDAALFANPDDSEDIADAITKFMKDEKLRNTISRKAKEQVKNVVPEVFQRQLANLLSD